MYVLNTNFIRLTFGNICSTHNIRFVSVEQEANNSCMLNMNKTSVESVKTSDINAVKYKSLNEDE